MSISALTTVAAARDVRPPTKRDAGKSKKPGDQSAAGLTDLLVTQVPTELVAPYTAVTAAIVAAIGKPTKQNAHPDQLTLARWIVFAILLVGTVALVWEGKKRKAGGGKLPLLEMTGALAAATGWALALPASPLVPYLHSEGARISTPLIIAFAAVVFTSVTAAALQGQRKSSTKSANAT